MRRLFQAFARRRIDAASLSQSLGRRLKVPAEIVAGHRVLDVPGAYRSAMGRALPPDRDRFPREADMAENSAVDQAIGRLERALDQVERAVERSLDQQRNVAGLEGEMQKLGADRSRLAQSLDAAEERSGRMEDANREVSRRLVTAMESIREVLARNGAA